MKVLWLRAPVQLMRFPSLLVSIAAVAAIASLSAASGPTFLASTQIGSLREGIDQASPWIAGFRAVYSTFYYSNSPEKLAARRYFRDVEDNTRTAIRELGDVEGVEGPIVGHIGGALIARGRRNAANVRMVNRTDALDHVTILDEGQGDGIWLADATATKLKVGEGDQISLATLQGRATVTVAGIYRYLAREAPRDYWLPLGAYIYRAPGDMTDPPALAIVDDRTYHRVMPRLLDFGSYTIEFPLSTDELSFADALRLDRTFQEAGGPISRAGADSSTNVGVGEISFALRDIVETANERLATVTPVVDLLSAAAGLLALTVAAAAGFYLVKRRRVEVRTLAARGVGPVAQGLRYGVESVLPITLGTALGTGFAYVLVTWLGPAEDLPVMEVGDASGAVIATAGLSLVALVIAACFAAWREEANIAASGPSHLHARWMQIAAIAAVAVGGVAYTMRESVSIEEVEDPRVTLVPVVMIIAGGIVAAVGVLALLPRLADRTRFQIPAVYLAARRLSGASGMSRLLIVAGASALGVAVYGLTMSASLDETATAKAKIFVGSDFSAVVGSDPSLPDIGYPLTHVSKVDRASFGEQGIVSLMGIDPTTFAETAYWQSAFAEESLESLLRRLDGPNEAGGVPVLTTADLGDSPILGSGETVVALEQVGTVTAFPGMPAERELVVMSRDSLNDTLAEIGGSTGSRDEEIWGRGPAAEIEDDLLRSGESFARPRDAEEVLDTPSLRSLLWMLGLLAALGAIAAIVAVASLLLYLQARQRTALVSSALTRRMGLTGGGEFLSWGTEIAGALGTSLVVAVAVGLPVSTFMIARLDPRPTLQPPPVLIVPVLLLGLLTLTLAVVSIGSAWRVKRGADAADMAEVMRT